MHINKARPQESQRKNNLKQHNEFELYILWHLICLCESRLKIYLSQRRDPYLHIPLTARHVLRSLQGMTPDLGMLRGLAVQEDAGTHKLVKLFAVHQLSDEPAARFKAVFQERALWSWHDLQPYVEDLQACAAQVGLQ